MEKYLCLNVTGVFMTCSSPGIFASTSDLQFGSI